MSAPNLRFGICTDQYEPYPVLVEKWRRYEELGFDSVWDCDHFNRPSDPEGPYFEGWTLLSALAAETSTIRVGVLVSSNTFRHPALLAQCVLTRRPRVEWSPGARDRRWLVPRRARAHGDRASESRTFVGDSTKLSRSSTACSGATP